MTEILAETDLTEPGEDGWRRRYRVRRRDGEEITVKAACTGTAAALATATGSWDALEFIADHGRGAALRCAESAQSPVRRGNVVVSVFVDAHSGALAIEYDYEHLP